MSDSHKHAAHKAMELLRSAMARHRELYRKRDGDAYTDPPMYRHYESLIAYVTELEGVGAPERASTHERLHAMCKAIRENTWSGIDESRAVCHGCPATEQSPYGPGTRGCYLLALELFNLAVCGNPLGLVAELAGDLDRAAVVEHEGHGYTVWRIGGRQFVPLDEANEAVRRARGDS